MASLAVYLVGMYQSRKQAVSGLVAYAVSALLLFLTMTPEERKSKHQRNQMWLMAAVFYIPALFMLITAYQGKSEERRFRAYLSAHDCTYSDTAVTGLTGSGCDRAGNCEERQEVHEDFYACGATGNRITFKQFSGGDYGTSE